MFNDNYIPSIYIRSADDLFKFFKSYKMHSPTDVIIEIRLLNSEIRRLESLEKRGWRFHSEQMLTITSRHSTLLSEDDEAPYMEN